MVYWCLAVCCREKVLEVLGPNPTKAVIIQPYLSFFGENMNVWNFQMDCREVD